MSLPEGVGNIALTHEFRCPVHRRYRTDGGMLGTSTLGAKQHLGCHGSNRIVVATLRQQMQSFT